MQHTAHHAIKTRLNLWRLFFATGNDTSPEGAEDAEYSLDILLDLAREGDNAKLHQLADATERMECAYMLHLDDQHADTTLCNQRYAAAMMRDDAEPPVLVTLDELDAALHAG
jgi:hypothetical protein